jgi:hypothetical protein
VLLLNYKVFMSLTPTRLKLWAGAGWVVTDTCVMNIPKWYGRYYLITFEQGGVEALHWI